MPDNMKRMSEELAEAMADLPESVRENFAKEWVAEARGAKKVCDLVQIRQPDPAA